MTTRLILVSHAATAATRAAAFPSGDEPPEEKSLRGAGRLDTRLSGYRGLASPARAAQATAVALGLRPAIEPALADCDYGAWRGRGIDEVQASDPAGFAAWLGDPEAAPHGGESVAALVARVGAWLAGDEVGHGRTVAVTHAAVIRAAVVSVLGAPLTAFWRIDVAPLAAAEFSASAGRWTLRSLGVAP